MGDVFERKSGRVEFADVTPDRKRLPSWVAKHHRGAAIAVPRRVDLKPANVPRDMAALDAAETEAMPPPTPLPVPPSPAFAPGFVAPVIEAEEHDSPLPEIVRVVIDEQATEALRVAVRDLVAARERIIRESEAELVKLATVIARKVIARELALDPRIVAGLVKEGLNALSAPDRLTVRIGVGFAAASTELMSVFASHGPNLRVLVDDKLELYGCVIEADLGRTDESVETRLTTLLGALVGDADEHLDR